MTSYDDSEQYNVHDAHGFLFAWHDDGDDGIDEIIDTTCCDHSLESCWVLLQRLCPLHREEILSSYEDAGAALLSALDRFLAGDPCPDPFETLSECSEETEKQLYYAAEAAAELVVEVEDFDL